MSKTMQSDPIRLLAVAAGVHAFDVVGDAVAGWRR